jgi:biopolymer transport protein TolR
MRRRVAEGVDPSEINLIPYLDIMVNLVMFLLVATTVAIELREVPYEPPGTGPGSGVSVAVFVGHDGITVRDGASAAAFPRASWPAVTAALEGIHEKQGDSVVAIAAEPDVPYDEVMAAIDAARVARDGKPLYPNFSLGE